MDVIRTPTTGLFKTLFTPSDTDFVDQSQQPSQHEIFPEEPNSADPLRN